MEIIRQVIAYKDYFLNFYEKQNNYVQTKIEWTLNLLQTLNRIPKKYFEHITGTNGIYEVRVEFGGNIFRIFAFLIKETLWFWETAFKRKRKKHQKIEIEKAIKIKQEYENETR